MRACIPVLDFTQDVHNFIRGCKPSQVLPLCKPLKYCFDLFSQLSVEKTAELGSLSLRSTLQDVLTCHCAILKHSLKLQDIGLVKVRNESISHV
jgi:hypothetical protein